jgi:hypothetical protein
MPVANQNNMHWNLESFLDSLIVELDKARETLALKAINKPLTYAVKDVSLDLQLFPSYDGDNVKFITAQPGQSGASKVSIQLGSITDQQVRETSKLPNRNDVSIDAIEDLDDITRKRLKKIGVTSLKDVEKIEKKNVDLQSAGSVKTDYKNLTALLEKSKRAKIPPSINRISISKTKEGSVLDIQGKNLALAKRYTPVAVINNELAEVMSCKPDQVLIRLKNAQMENPENEVILTLDPFAIVKMNIHSKNTGNEK